MEDQTAFIIVCFVLAIVGTIMAIKKRERDAQAEAKRSAAEWEAQDRAWRERERLKEREAELRKRQDDLLRRQEENVRIMRGSLLPDECPGCGAPVRGDKCEYCGRSFLK